MSQILIPANAPMASARRLRSVIDRYRQATIIWPTSPLESHEEPEQKGMLFFRQEFRFGTVRENNSHGRLVLEAHRDHGPQGAIRLQVWHVYRDGAVELNLGIASWQDPALVRNLLDLRNDLTEWVARGAFDRRP